MFLFNSNKKNANKKRIQENKRMIDRAIRELDRERTSLQAQESKLVIEIKRFAKENQMDAAKVTAKSIVRNRVAVTKLYQLKTQLQAISLRMAELKSTQAMGEAMQGTAKAMAIMNRRLQQPAIAKIMKDFEIQNSRMNATSMMMDDAVAGFDNEMDDLEAKEDELVHQVLDEIGVSEILPDVVVGTSTAGIRQEAAPNTSNDICASSIDEDLQAQLRRVRGDCD